MKPFVVFAAILAMCSAEPPVSGGYSSGPSGGSSGGFGGYSSGDNGGFFGSSGGSGFGDSGFGGVGGGAGGSSGPQIRKFVSVHIAPQEGTSQESRVIRVPGGQDKHVNIIFVKTPSGSSEQQTEVILPEQPQQRNLVYVLVKKEEVGSNLKIRGPQPTSPSKPEVYFIRYKNDGGAGGAESSGGFGGSSSSTTGGFGGFGSSGSSSSGNGGYSGPSSVPTAYGAP